jgi:hypothetical protein
MALERPNALAYLRAQRKALLASLGPKTIHRLDALAHQEENRGAGVAACRTLIGLPDDEPGAVGIGVPRAPGIVVQIINNPPADTSRHATITITPAEREG